MVLDIPSGHAGVLPSLTNCANRPCFPGVLCIDRKPPKTGYFCGRCPVGLNGNGRICTKTSRPGTFLSLGVSEL